MDIKRVGSQPSAKGPSEWFTGTVRIDPLFQAPDPGRVSGGSVKASSWGVSLVAIAPLQQFDIYGRVGYARTESKANFSIPGEGSASTSERQNEAFYGVGGRYNWANFGVFVEWNKHDKVDINYVLLGVEARF